MPIAALCFVMLPVRRAILVTLIGGWWLLPVGRYGPIPPNGNFAWWITGIALPSDMLLTKAWIPPLAAFIGAALGDGATLRKWRPSAIDLPMAGWCLWPLVNGFGVAPDPAGWLASAYNVGAWGLPWLIARVWLAGKTGQLALTEAIALSGLANLPVALIEGVRPPMLYDLIYGPHPFRLDGIGRYVGYRPIGFFENGNSYGLWAAIAAFASIWLVREHQARGRGWLVLAVANVIVALASQSVGAIFLLGVGLALLALWRLPIFLPVMTGTAALLLLVATVHLSGIVPLQSLARSPAGEKTIAAMRSIGRGSFLWRLSQDSKTLASIAQHPVAGNAHWDWWRSYGTRPWGQAVLLIGQFGLVGFALAWGALLAACAVAFARLRKLHSQLSADPALPLAIITLLALADAALNAFFFFPAIVAAGAIAAARGCREEPKPLEPLS